MSVLHYSGLSVDTSPSIYLCCISDFLKKKKKKVSLSELFTCLMATVSSYGIMPFTVTVKLFMTIKVFLINSSYMFRWFLSCEKTWITSFTGKRGRQPDGCEFESLGHRDEIAIIRIWQRNTQTGQTSGLGILVGLHFLIKSFCVV